MFPAASAPLHLFTLLSCTFLFHLIPWPRFSSTFHTECSNRLASCEPSCFSFYFCSLQKRAKKIEGETLYTRHSNLMLEVCIWRLSFFALYLLSISLSHVLLHGYFCLVSVFLCTLLTSFHCVCFFSPFSVAWPKTLCMHNLSQ